MRTLGRYELLRPLARGGMAEVYLARRRVAGVEKRLVIKRLRRERTADPRFLDLFVKEAQLSMSLVQQNIVPVFDFGRAGDDVFLAMEHIDGKDLGSSLARRRGAGMPPLVAAFVASECCHALHHAHRGVAGGSVSVVHRDVTPRNVLLSWAGEVKLADFGIAAAMGGGEGALAGTPNYMAPEQARGEPLDARADLYSLGLVLWEMLTGEHVRPGAERGELLEAARHNRLPPLPPELPPPLAELLRAATAGTPEARLPSAQAMADQLDAFMVAERTRAGGASPARQLAAWLAERWAGAADEPLELDGAAGGPAVTFLDDGAAGVLGSETLRSMAATAAPESSEGSKENSEGSKERGDAEPPAAASPASSDASDSAPSSASGTAPIASPIADVAVSPAAPRRTGRGLALLGAALAAGLGAVLVYRAIPEERSPESPESPELPTLAAFVDAAVDAALADAAFADAASPSSPSPSPSPAVTSPDAPPPSPSPSPPAPSPRHRPVTPRPASPSPAVTPAPPAAPAPAAALRRAFTIGARPWAHFTLDGEAQRYETPATLELSLGAHRVRFENPALGVVQEVTITVTADGPASYLQQLR